jgi:polar amino acid transport system ATP-binding protein
MLPNSILQIRNLSLRKVKKNQIFPILNEVSLDFPTHKISLLLGKSGSGKTSILRCISQLDRKYQGEIWYQAKNLKQYSQKERCQMVGFVPQSYTLFPFMSVLDNCIHPLKTVLGLSRQEAIARVAPLFSSLEMDHLIHSAPHELSGGQQQRTAIVRALALHPSYLLLDEPTSALDPENTDLLVQILCKLKREGRGIIISSQDMHFAAKILERVYFLENGKIVENYDFSLTKLTDLSKDTRLSRFIVAPNTLNV